MLPQYICLSSINLAPNEISETKSQKYNTSDTIICFLLVISFFCIQFYTDPMAVLTDVKFVNFKISSLPLFS